MVRALSHKPLQPQRFGRGLDLAFGLKDALGTEL